MGLIYFWKRAYRNRRRNRGLSLMWSESDYWGEDVEEMESIGEEIQEAVAVIEKQEAVLEQVQAIHETAAASQENAEEAVAVSCEIEVKELTAEEVFRKRIFATIAWTDRPMRLNVSSQVKWTEMRKIIIPAFRKPRMEQRRWHYEKREQGRRRIEVGTWLVKQRVARHQESVKEERDKVRMPEAGSMKGRQRVRSVKPKRMCYPIRGRPIDRIDNQRGKEMIG